MKLYKYKTQIDELTEINDILKYIKTPTFKQFIDVTKLRAEKIINIEKLTTTKLDFEIRQLFKYAPKVQSNLNVKYWVYRGWSEEEGKEQISKIQQINSNKFIAKVKSGNINHNWSEQKLLETYSEDETKEILSTRGSVGGVASLTRRNNNPEKYYHTFNTRIEYYLNKGLTQKDVKKLY